MLADLRHLMPASRGGPAIGAATIGMGQGDPVLLTLFALVVAVYVLLAARRQPTITA